MIVYIMSMIRLTMVTKIAIQITLSASCIGLIIAGIVGLKLTSSALLESQDSGEQCG